MLKISLSKLWSSLTGNDRCCCGRDCPLAVAGQSVQGLLRRCTGNFRKCLCDSQSRGHVICGVELFLEGLCYVEGWRCHLRQQAQCLGSLDIAPSFGNHVEEFR